MCYARGKPPRLVLAHSRMGGGGMSNKQKQ